MKPGDEYHRFAHWSEEDQCYIGYCPDLYFGGVCHAANELEAYGELCSIIQDEVRHRTAKGEALSACRPHHPRLAFRHRLRRGRESVCSRRAGYCQPNGPVWKAQFRTHGAATKISPAITPKAQPQSLGGRWKTSAPQLSHRHFAGEGLALRLETRILG